MSPGDIRKRSRAWAARHAVRPRRQLSRAPYYACVRGWRNTAVGSEHSRDQVGSPSTGVQQTIARNGGFDCKGSRDLIVGKKWVQTLQDVLSGTEDERLEELNEIQMMR